MLDIVHYRNKGLNAVLDRTLDFAPEYWIHNKGGNQSCARSAAKEHLALGSTIPCSP
jgi:hypothetical protein